MKNVKARHKIEINASIPLNFFSDLMLEAISRKARRCKNKAGRENITPANTVKI
jgi:hypothetical protein